MNPVTKIYVVADLQDAMGGRYLPTLGLLHFE